MLVLPAQNPLPFFKQQFLNSPLGIHCPFIFIPCGSDEVDLNIPFLRWTHNPGWANEHQHWDIFLELLGKLLFFFSVALQVGELKRATIAWEWCQPTLELTGRDWQLPIMWAAGSSCAWAYKIPGFSYSDSTGSFFFFFNLRPVELSLPSPDKHKEINIGSKEKGRVNTGTSGNFPSQLLRQFLLNSLLLDTSVLPLCPIYQVFREKNFSHWR